MSCLYTCTNDEQTTLEVDELLRTPPSDFSLIQQDSLYLNVQKHDTVRFSSQRSEERPPEGGTEDTVSYVDRVPVLQKEVDWANRGCQKDTDETVQVWIKVTEVHHALSQVHPLEVSVSNVSMTVASSDSEVPEGHRGACCLGSGNINV